ncbi:MAG: M48 family metalloprotease [Desulfamplus sp.]|nr:M48 family metalloprotease [Desulfamplus sp.]
MKKIINMAMCMVNKFIKVVTVMAISAGISGITGISGFFCNSAFAISISKEKEIAVEFMDAIDRQDKLVKDPMALALISEIGEQILKVLPPQPFRYSFYIMDEDQFNAFAGPGSNIFVHRGLITALDNVDELAGIIGHEIAHSSCRHISQMVDQSKIMTIGTLAGVLAGVLVGATGGGGEGDLGQAVLIGSVAASHTAMLSYSREHETEADQKGLVYLSQTGFNPYGLLTGLEKIRSRDWFGTESIPDYLKTHPGSTERIVQIQSWIEGQGKEEVKQNSNKKNDSKEQKGILKDTGKKADIPKDAADKADGARRTDGGERRRTDGGERTDGRKNTIDPFRFEMVKYRLAGMYGNEDESEKLLIAALEKDPDNSAARYGMALLMERKSRFKESIDQLRQALETRAFDPYILLAMGKVNIMAGEPRKAFEIMQGLENIPEVEIEASFYISQAMIMTGKSDMAEKGFEKVIDAAADIFPKAYYHLAQIKGERGETALSHYYLGLYYYEMKNMKSARFHLLKSLETLSEADKKRRAQSVLIKSEIRQKDMKRNKR